MGRRRIYDDPAYRRARRGISKLPCDLCGADPPSTVDHIVPVVFGGTNSPDNLRPLCLRCNSSRGARHRRPSNKRRRNW